MSEFSFPSGTFPIARHSFHSYSAIASGARVPVLFQVGEYYQVGSANDAQRRTLRAARVAAGCRRCFSLGVAYLAKEEQLPACLEDRRHLDAQCRTRGPCFLLPPPSLSFSFLAPCVVRILNRRTLVSIAFPAPPASRAPVPVLPALLHLTINSEARASAPMRL